MDAIVFFAAAMIISSMMVSFAGHGVDNDLFGQEASPAESLLNCFLSSSILSNLTVQLSDQIDVRWQTSVRYCLAFEGDALFRGVELDSFAELNGLLWERLSASVPCAFAPHLLLLSYSYSEPLLALPHVPQTDALGSSSSAAISPADEAKLSVVLVLCPATSSELM